MGNRVELDEMGKRILDASRTDLYLSMRFLGPALHSLGFIMDLSTTTVGTDAAYIRFNPNHLFRLYVDRPRRLNRTYLHMILHCVFRHMFTARKKEDRELWDLSCDIAVTSIIDSMDYRAVAELTPEFRQRVYDRLQEEIHVLTAERIYQYFLERKRNYMEELQLAVAFALDDHSFWERMEDEENRDPEDGSKSDQDPDDEKKQDRDPGTDSPDEKGADQKTPGDNEEKKDSESTSPDSRDPSGQDRDPGGEKTGVRILPTGTGRGTGKTGGIPTGTPGTEMPADAGRTDDCPASNPPKSWKVTGRKPPGAWKRRYLPRARRPRMSAEAWTGSSRSPTGAGRITGSFCGSLPSCGK